MVASFVVLFMEGNTVEGALSRLAPGEYHHQRLPPDDYAALGGSGGVAGTSGVGGEQSSAGHDVGGQGNGLRASSR